MPIHGKRVHSEEQQMRKTVEEAGYSQGAVRKPVWLERRDKQEIELQMKLKGDLGAKAGRTLWDMDRYYFKHDFILSN